MDREAQINDTIYQIWIYENITIAVHLKAFHIGLLFWGWCKALQSFLFFISSPYNATLMIDIMEESKTVSLGSCGGG